MTNSELQEQIENAPGPVVVLTGPAGCGKTTAALDLYRNLIGEDGVSACMLLAPNISAADHLRRRLLDDSETSTLVGARVNTFPRLAAGVLAGSNAPGRRISPFQRHLLLSQIVGDLSRRGKLNALDKVADTPGLVIALDRAIGELKRAAVEPETLAPAVRSGPAKERDLLEVYRCYQNRLQADGLFDVEGQIWLARDRLSAAADCESGDLPGLNGVTALAVDGFTDFTPTQLEMLDSISRKNLRILITLTLDDDGRDRMWFWTRRTLNAIQATFGDRVSIVHTAPDTATRTSLERLTDNLFDLDAEPADPPDGLSVVSAPNIETEVAAAARGIKRLLLDGASGRSIAVLARSLEPYRRAIQRVFALHNIPIAESPGRLSDAPIVRFLLDTAEAAPQLSHSAVLRIISNSYFRPEALGEFTTTDASAAELIIRQGNVLEGRSSYAQAADRLAWMAARNAPDNEDPKTAGLLQLGPIEVTPQHIASAAKLLEALFDAIQSANGNPLVLGRTLGVAQTVMELDDPVLIARDMRALAALDQVVGTLQETPTGVDLRAALSQATCPARRVETLVDVLDVIDARALRYKHVFLIGLGQGHFPAKITDNSLLGQAQRIRWSKHGIALDTHRDLASREMLLFYLAASRATESMTLTYVTSDASGRPSARGGFLTSLLEPAGGIDVLQSKGRYRDIPLGSFLPDRGEIACARDALIGAAAGWFDPTRGCDDSAMAWIARHDPQKLTRVAAGLWASHKRWRSGRADAFDGRLDDTKLTAELKRRYPDQVVFSASSLNTFGQCPWRYFARYVLGLEPLAVPQRMLQPTSRGQFVHNVLFATMKRLFEAAGGPVRPDQIADAEMTETLQGAVSDLSEPLEEAAPYPALWRIQRDRLHAQMRSYLLSLKNAEPRGRCGHFELGFGLQSRPGEPTDNMSRHEPVVLHTPAGDIRLRGKIDRIDRMDSESLRVIDYKTGALPSPGDIAAGRNLQLPLYSAAAAEILSNESSGGAFHRIGIGSGKKRLDFSPDTADSGVARLGGYDEINRSAMQSVANFVTAMSKGQFDLYPTHNCPSYCPFRQICQFSPTRAEVKLSEGQS
ncbi:MAG: PD-(D/E)XK nuclease family protein [Phycisphaerae bacterium]|jgi:RecB family exonuclease/superfamily I DNA/RNA helicase|nr:PD-(D/E)XK nuclease family protein [Phycisphaerae bacterium]